MVLLLQHFLQRPKPHLFYVPKFTMPVEEVFGILATAAYALWHPSKQLNEQCQVIFIPVYVQLSHLANFDNARA